MRGGDARTRTLHPHPSRPHFDFRGCWRTAVRCGGLARARAAGYLKTWNDAENQEYVIWECTQCDKPAAPCLKKKLSERFQDHLTAMHDPEDDHGNDGARDQTLAMELFPSQTRKARAAKVQRAAAREREAEQV